MKKILLILAVAAITMVTANAMATPIAGKIDFAGGLTLVGGTNLAAATGIHFTNPSLVVTGATGTFASVPGFPPFITPVTFSDFAFTSVTASGVPLWTFTSGLSAFDFMLTSITEITATSLSGNGVMSGVMGGTIFDSTDSIWQLTTQNGTGILSFSSSSAPVPEPGTMVLFGVGLLGLAIYGKRRMNKES